MFLFYSFEAEMNHYNTVRIMIFILSHVSIQECIWTTLIISVISNFVSTKHRKQVIPGGGSVSIQGMTSR